MLVWTIVIDPVSYRPKWPNTYRSEMAQYVPFRRENSILEGEFRSVQLFVQYRTVPEYFSCIEIFRSYRHNFGVYRS